MAYPKQPTAKQLEDTLNDISNKRKNVSNAYIDAAISDVMQYFAYQHLPERLQLVSSPFYDLAVTCSNQARNSQQTIVALQKLLEAKDAAVRAALHDYP